MELRHLRYFLAVAELGSFTHAARRLRISQPTLSHQIRQLEKTLGTILLDRTGRQVVMTAAGRTFQPHCEQMLKDLDAGVLAVSELRGLMRGTLQMAVFQSFSGSRLGPVLSEFAVRYPGVRVVARQLPRVDMERELLSGALDLAVAYIAGNDPRIQTEPLFEEELVLIVGANHPLARTGRMPMRKLADLALALLTPEFAVRQIVDAFFARHRLEPRIVLEMNAVEPILATLRNATLATVLSSGAIGERTGLRTVRLTHPTPKRVGAILRCRGRHPSVAALRMAQMIRAAYQAQPR